MATFAELAAANGFTVADIQHQLTHWDENRGPLVIIVTTILVACASVAVILRLTTRKVIVKLAWQVDDYAILGALVRHCRETHIKVADHPKIFAMGLYVETVISIRSSM